jgi:hypothetical protein
MVGMAAQRVSWVQTPGVGDDGTIMKQLFEYGGPDSEYYRDPTIDPAGRHDRHVAGWLHGQGRRSCRSRQRFRAFRPRVDAAHRPPAP